MANDYRDRDRYRPMRGPGGDEGFRQNDYGDFNRGDYATGRDYAPARESHRGKGPKNYQRSDDRIREDVCERLAMDDDVDASDLEVTVSGGTVVLAGSVTDRWAKRRAEDIAESVAGVRDIENQIRVARSV